MIQKQINGLSLWCFENLFTYEEIGHFISTRTGGHSDPPYDSFNLSFSVGDDSRKVLRNRERLAGALGILLADLTTAKQVHGCHVEVISEPMQGRGSMDDKGAVCETDAMVTDVPGLCVMILLADCVPVILYDPARRVVGVAHAGWKGTLGSIAPSTVKVFQDHFGCSPQDIIAGIGPSIGPCCYEVGPEVVSQVERVFGTKEDCIVKESADGRGHFDLRTANLKQLVQAGVPEKNIEISPICTYDHPNLFFSHRHEKGKTGRFGAGIFIRG